MWCPICEEDGIRFQGVNREEKEWVELRFRCIICDRVFYVEVEEEDLREVD